MTEHKHRKHFIKEWRQFRGLSQQKLADRLSTSKGHVSNLEKGKVRFNETNLNAFADALSVEPWELLAVDPFNRHHNVLFDRLRYVRDEDIPRIAAIIETFVPADRAQSPPITAPAPIRKARTKKSAG